MTDPSRYPPGWNPPPPGPYQGQPPANPYYYQPGYNWPGYGEAPPIHGRPPKRSKTSWIIAAVAAVLVIAIVAGGVLWRFNSGGEDTEAATTTTSATTSTTATPECEGRVASPTPQTPPDWIAVASPRGLGYDVPPDWTVNSCTTMIGWEVPCPDGPFGFCPVRTMTGSAEMPNKQCPDLHRGATGVPGANSTDDIDEALQRETQLVEDIYTSRSGVVPTVSLGERRELTVSGEPAVQVIATVTGIEASECTGPSALHSMLATKVDGQPGSVMFIVSLEQGYPGAPDPKLIDEIVATLRKDD